LSTSERAEIRRSGRDAAGQLAPGEVRRDVERGRTALEGQPTPQTSLAEQLGVTFQQVQKYEKGVNRVGGGRLTKIAKVLGVPVVTFFGAHDAAPIERGDRAMGSSPLKLLTVPAALKLLRSYGQLNDGKMRRSIVGLVENIAAGRR
jgi:transcriptional regulator with XRE-family HTH domain